MGAQTQREVAHRSDSASFCRAPEQTTCTSASAVPEPPAGARTARVRAPSQIAGVSQRVAIERGLCTRTMGTMERFQNILVATDFSEASELAVGAAPLIEGGVGTRVTLLHVVNTPELA